MSDKIVNLGSKKKEKQNAGDLKKVKSENSNSNNVICSFCNRPNTQVIKMIQGPGVNICSECTMIAVQYLILNDRIPTAEAQQILDAFWGKAR